jgi:hypothetical protein
MSRVFVSGDRCRFGAATRTPSRALLIAIAQAGLALEADPAA